MRKDDARVWRTHAPSEPAICANRNFVSTNCWYSGHLPHRELAGQRAVLAVGVEVVRARRAGRAAIEAEGPVVAAVAAHLQRALGLVEAVVAHEGHAAAEAARAAGAEHVGFEDLIKKVNEGWTDFDVAVATPNAMKSLRNVARVLGPRGLMPNPKTGTVTDDVAKAVTEVKGGKIDFKVDKFGIVHAGIGRVSFSPKQLEENAVELLQTIVRLKPSAAKGTYIKSIYLSSTMSPGICIEPKSIPGI